MSYFVGLGSLPDDSTIQRVVGDSPAAVFAQAAARALTIGLVYQFPDRDRPGRLLLLYGPSVSLPGHMVVWHQLLGWLERLCSLWKEHVIRDHHWARERAAGRALAHGLAHHGARPFPELAEWVHRFGHGTVSLVRARVSTLQVFAHGSAFAARWLWPVVVNADANPQRESGEESMSAADKEDAFRRMPKVGMSPDFVAPLELRRFFPSRLILQQVFLPHSRIGRSIALLVAAPLSSGAQREIAESVAESVIFVRCDDDIGRNWDRVLDRWEKHLDPWLTSERQSIESFLALRKVARPGEFAVPERGLDADMLMSIRGIVYEFSKDTLWLLARDPLDTNVPVGSLPPEVRRTRMVRCSDDPIENWLLVTDAVEREWDRWRATQATTAIHPPGNGAADPWECELFRDESYSFHPGMEAIRELAAAAVTSDGERLSTCMILLRCLIHDAARSGHLGLRFQTDGDRYECLKPDGTWESGEELPSWIGLRIAFLDLLVACVGVHPGTALPFEGRFTVDSPPWRVHVEMRTDWTARGKGIEVRWTVSGGEE